jgi:perosamine synthetase
MGALSNLSEIRIPLAVPNLCGREAEYLNECVRSTFVSTVGPFVTRFEQMVAQAAGAPFAVATCSGTAGLHASLVAVGVNQNDLVICPTLTFIATANAITHAGAKPWLFDVAEASWTLDPCMLEDVLRSETVRAGGKLIHVPSGRSVAAIVPVYALGLPADMNAIIATAKEFGLPVVADAAAALGGTYRGRPCGALDADVTMFSFNGNKTVTSGGGGAIVGTDPDLVNLVRHLTTTARLGSEYVHDRAGFNYRMTNLEAAVGCAQMENLDAFVAAKRRIAMSYDEAFADLPNLSSFPKPNFAESACWFSGVVFGHELNKDATRIHRKLREHGIDARPFWRPMHLQLPYLDSPRTDVKVSTDLWPRVLTLPCSTHLTKSDQDYVIAVLRKLIQDD